MTNRNHGIASPFSRPLADAEFSWLGICQWRTATIDSAQQRLRLLSLRRIGLSGLRPRHTKRESDRHEYNAAMGWPLLIGYGRFELS